MQKKTDEGYIQHEERFIRKLDPKISHFGNYNWVVVNSIKGLPLELEQKVFKDKRDGSNHKTKYLLWEDIKNWMDINYQKSANQRVDPTVKTLVESGNEQGTAAEI